MKPDQSNIKGTRSSTTRLRHDSRDTGCVRMMLHIQCDIEKKTKSNTLQTILDCQQRDATLKSEFAQNQVRTISSQMTHQD